MEKNINILYIEDDPYYSQLLQIQLNRIAGEKGLYRFSYDVVPSTTAAYQKLDNNKYDCIISDYQIITGSGLDVLMYIKEKNIDVPFIFLTGQGDERVAREAFIQGANDYFTKNITIADYDRIYNSIINQITHFETKKLQKDYENRYKTIFENTNAALVLIDEDMTISLMNHEFEKISGYNKEEVEGKVRWTELVQEGDIEVMKKYHQDRRAGKKDTPNAYYFHSVDKWGRNKFVFLSVAMIPNTDKSLASLIDLTEQMEAISALEESEKRYRTLYETSRDAIWTVTKEGEIEDANKASLNMLGYARDELIGMNIQSLYICPDDRKKFIDEMERCSSIKDYEVRLRRKDGKEMDCLLTSTLWQDNDGSILGYQSIIRDVTDKRATERLLREHTRELSCLYDIALACNSSLSWDEICSKVVDLVPASLQYPDIACAQLTISGKTYRSKGCKETKRKLRETVGTGESEGIMEVYYLEDAPYTENGLFSKEEKKIIHTILKLLQKIDKNPCLNRQG